MQKKIRLGIVGRGFGSQVLHPAFLKNEAFEVLKPVGRADWKSLIDDRRVDALAIAVPPGEQAAIALTALESGIHLFLEKPVGVSLESAKKIADLARTKNLACSVDFEFASLPEWKKFREILPTLGKIRHVQYQWLLEHTSVRDSFAGSKHAWKQDAKNGGGALQQFGSHSLHALEYFFSKTDGGIVRILCDLRNPNHFDKTIFRADTYCELWCEFESGLKASLFISTHVFAGAGHKIEVAADLGSVVLLNPTSDYLKNFRIESRLRQHPTEAENKAVLSSFVSDFDFGTLDSRVAAVFRVTENFSDWIQTGKPSGPTVWQGLRVQQLIEAAKQSSERSNTWVAV